MSDVENFRKAVEKYLAVGKKEEEKNWTKFAGRLGFSREDVSRMLHGQAPLPEGFVHRVIKELAGWKCIETRDQAQALLAIIGAPGFQPEDRCFLLGWPWLTPAHHGVKGRWPVIHHPGAIAAASQPPALC